MKNVVILKSKTKSQGGLEKYSHRIVHAFEKTGANVTLLSGEAFVNYPSFLKIERFDQYAQNWVKKHQPDLIFGLDRNRLQTHLRMGNGVHAAYLDRRRKWEGLFKSISFYINPLHRKILEIEKCAFQNPRLEKIFANSHMVKNEIIQYYNVDPKKIIVIHNGVEWEEFQGAFDQWEEKKNSAIFHFLFIGHGFQRKGLGRLLQGLSQIPEKEWKLLVIGKDRNEFSFKKMAQKLGLKEKVHFLGEQTQVTPFYQLCDALVIPSLYDPFANVTVEALAMGLHVISSKNNGGHEILNESNGIVFEEDIESALRMAFKYKKSRASALQKRESVAHLDFSKQMQLLMSCL